MTSSPAEHVKILFFVEDDASDQGEIESLWAIKTADGYRLDNIPFYAREVAWQDVVKGRTDEDGMIWFDGLITPSGHSTVRVLLSSLETMIEVCNAMEELGCSWEQSDVPKLIAFDVPPEVEYASVRNFLEHKADQGILEFEEGCLGFCLPIPERSPMRLSINSVAIHLIHPTILS